MNILHEKGLGQYLFLFGNQMMTRKSDRGSPTRTCQHPVATHLATTVDLTLCRLLPKSFATSIDVWLNSRLLNRSQPISLLSPPELLWWQIPIDLFHWVHASLPEQKILAANTLCSLQILPVLPSET